MKNKITFLLFFIAFTYVSEAQPPCLVQFSSVNIDSTASNCNYKQLKYTTTGGTIQSYKWTYGDGNSCTCSKPKHFYTQNGTFKVCGYITDNNGCIDSICTKVTVNCNNPCQLSEIGIQSADTLSYSCNEMEFNALVSKNTKKSRWYFGDGDSSVNLYEVHTYNQNGTYQAKLIIYDSIGCSDTANFEIAIQCSNEPQKCTFELQNLIVENTSNCKTKLLKLSANKFIESVKWTYNNTSVLNDSTQFRITFSDTGFYQICAIAKDTGNCYDTLCVATKVTCTNQNNSITSFDVNDLNIYPNPTNGLVFFKTEKTFYVNIYDLLGKCIGTKIINKEQNSIDFSEFNITNSMCLVQLTDGYGKTKSILIQIK